MVHARWLEIRKHFPRQPKSSVETNSEWNQFERSIPWTQALLVFLMRWRLQFQPLTLEADMLLPSVLAHQKKISHSYLILVVTLLGPNASHVQGVAFHRMMRSSILPNQPLTKTFRVPRNRASQLVKVISIIALTNSRFNNQINPQPGDC
jgi:hypothetical protein